MDEKSIGKTIRTIREDAGVTLTALAELTGMAKGSISKIENGATSAPLSTLLRIADALQVPLADFFEEDTTSPRYVLTKAGNGEAINRDGSRFGYTYRGLSLKLKDKAAEPFLLTIGPGDPAGEFRHGGEEFIYMLNGELEFTIGDEVLNLGPGDSLYFHADIIHRTKIIGEENAEFLCIFIQNRHKGGIR